MSAAAARLLESLRAVESLPVHVHARDAARVVAGRKPLVDGRAAPAGRQFSFQCTACGACCRALAAHIVLTPHDVFVASRSAAYEAARAATDGDWASTWGQRYRIVRGRMERAGTEEFADIPLLAFRTVSEETRGRRRAGEAAGGVRCPFAQEVEGKGKGGGGAKRLRCQLGAEGMPGACALYPFGELMTARGLGKEEDDEERRWMTIDADGCEGVAEVAVGERQGVVWMGREDGEAVRWPERKGVGLGEGTVAEYRRARSLDDRQLVHEWWMRFSQDVALRGAWSAQRFADIGALWYNPDRWEGRSQWDHVQAHLEAETFRILGLSPYRRPV
jgi:hypothetical protein